MAERAVGRFGLRLAFWYAGVFVVSSLAIIYLTYTLLASSLAERDRQLVNATLREYSERYAVGGLPALARSVEIGQASGQQERFFVRVVREGSEAVFISGSAGLWEQAARDPSSSTLEVASAKFLDGTLLQVGKSTESREAILRQFRTIVGLISIAIVLTGLVGGILVTRSTLRPIHRLIRAVTTIISTGSTDTRVPVRADRDAIDELSALFNQMLDRITTLIEGMGNALDNVAHDLRTPMTRLRGLAERALESGDAAQQREALATCIEESDRILAMLNTLMDISEAETGTMRLTRTDVDLASLVEETVDVYQDVAEERQIAVSASVEPNLTVNADRDRLRQVLANLLDNALKYTPSGGQVTIAARLEGPNIRLDVKDTGAGIAAHDLPRIWERLYRGDQSRAERGLGLGLSLVRAIVLAHRGSVSVESELGRGSTFTVILPTAPKNG